MRHLANYYLPLVSVTSPNRSLSTKDCEHILSKGKQLVVIEKPTSNDMFRLNLRSRLMFDGYKM